MAVETFPNTNILPSAAALGYGSAFSIGVGVLPATAVYTQLVEVTDIDWSGFNIGKEEVTNLGSPAMTKEYIPGLIEPGTLTVEGNWVGGDATLASLYTSIAGRTIQSWQVQALSNNKTKTTTMQCLGFLTKFNPMGKITADKPVKYSAELQITGTVIFTEV